MALQYPGKHTIFHFIKTKVNAGETPFQYLACTWQGRELPKSYKPTPEEEETYARLYWDRAINNRDNPASYKKYVDYIESGDVYSEGALQSPQEAASPPADEVDENDMESQLQALLDAEPAPLAVLRNSEHEASVKKITAKAKEMSISKPIDFDVHVPAAVAAASTSASDSLLKKQLISKVKMSSLIKAPSAGSSASNFGSNDYQRFEEWPEAVKTFTYWAFNITNNKRKRKEFEDKWNNASDAVRAETMQTLYGKTRVASELRYFQGDQATADTVVFWLHNRMNLLRNV